MVMMKAFVPPQHGTRDAACCVHCLQMGMVRASSAWSLSSPLAPTEPRLSGDTACDPIGTQSNATLVAGSFLIPDCLVHVLNRCGHIYGKECIETWLQHDKRCPQCKKRCGKPHASGAFGSALLNDQLKAAHLLCCCSRLSQSECTCCAAVFAAQSEGARGDAAVQPAQGAGATYRPQPKEAAAADAAARAGEAGVCGSFARAELCTSCSCICWVGVSLSESHSNQAGTLVTACTICML